MSCQCLGFHGATDRATRNRKGWIIKMTENPYAPAPCANNAYPPQYGYPAPPMAYFPAHFNAYGQYVQPGYYPVPVFIPPRKKTPDEFGFWRRLWRAIYPIPIFYGTQIAGVLIFTILFGIFLGASIAVNDLNPTTDQINQTAFYAGPWIYLLGESLIFAPILPIWLKTRKHACYKKFTGGRVVGSRILLAAASATFFNLFIHVIIHYVLRTRESANIREVMPFLRQGLSPEAARFEYALTLIPFIAIVGPIVEELCFRGIILNRLSNRSVWIAVPIQAVMFGLFHLNLIMSLIVGRLHPNWIQDVYTMILGLLLGIVYVRHKSIFYPIAIHMAFNLAGIFVPFIPLGSIPPIITCVIAGSLAIAFFVPLIVTKAVPKGQTAPPQTVLQSPLTNNNLQYAQFNINEL